MTVALGRRALGVPQETAYDRQRNATTCPDTGEAMPQIVQPDALEAGDLAYSHPRLSEIYQMVPCPIASNGIGVFRHARERRQDLEQRIQEAPDLQSELDSVKQQIEDLQQRIDDQLN